jgi:septum formation protein
MQLILASQSKYRKAQLEHFGVAFIAHAPRVDEEYLKVSGPKDIEELTRFLALHKAESLRPLFPRAVILGGDQVAEIDGERLDKPGTFERAKDQLLRLQGRTHRLITTLVVQSPESALVYTDVTKLRLRRLSETDIEDYLNIDKPFDCAGSYKFEKAGIALVERIQTQDPSAIQGVPLLSLTTAFNKLGVSMNQVWRKR